MGGFMNKKAILQYAKGFSGRGRNCYRLARRRVEKALQHSYIGRKHKKRDHRSVWIQRINAATRQHDMTYGNFICGLNKVGIELNRKIMSHLAINEPFTFRAIVSTVQQESLIPLKHFPTHGLLQTSVTNDYKPSNKRPVPKWNQGPITTQLGWQGKDGEERQ